MPHRNKELAPREPAIQKIDDDPKPDAKVERMSYWDRYMVDHKEKFGNISASDNEETNVAFTRKELPGNISYTGRNSELPTTSRNLDRIAAMPIPTSSNMIQDAFQVSDGSTSSRFSEYHKKSPKLLSSNEVGSSEGENIRDLAYSLRKRELVENSAGILRTPLKQPLKHSRVGFWSKSRQRAETEREPLNDLTRDPYQPRSYNVENSSAEEELCKLHCPEMLSNSSSNSDPLLTTSDPNFKVVFHPTLPSLEANDDAINSAGVSQPYTVKIGSRPRAGRAGPIVQFLQGLSSVRRSKPKPRSVHFSIDSDNNTKNQKQPPQRTKFGRRLKQLRKFPWNNKGRRVEQETSCDTATSSDCFIAGSRTNPSESESTAFSSDNERRGFLRTKKSRERSRITPLPALGIMDVLKKWSDEFIKTIGWEKYAPDTRPSQSLECFIPPALSRIIDGENVDAVIRAAISTFDVAIRVLALMILLFYISEHLVLRTYSSVPI